MNVVALDMSSTCIGLTFARLDGDKFEKVRTTAIMPQRKTGRDFGFTTEKPKKIETSRKTFKAYLKEGEKMVSEAEAKKRTAFVKSSIHAALLKEIGELISKLLDFFKPSVILLERNESFNGILTTKLLAEIAGGIHFYAGEHGIKLFDYNVNTVRACIRKDLPLPPQIGKIILDKKYEIFRRLKHFFEEHLIFISPDITMDESDSLAALYYWYVTDRKGIEE